jgi:DNA-binding PadR family transcriptional regulator
MLEDMGYVSSLQQDGKKVYQITEEGRAFLAQHRETVEGIRGRMRSRFAPWDEEEVREFADEMREFASDMKDFAKLFASSQGRAWRDPATRQRIREILKRTRQEIDEILREA